MSERWTRPPARVVIDIDDFIRALPDEIHCGASPLVHLFTDEETERGVRVGVKKANPEARRAVHECRGEELMSE